jgi:hypothetical protein
MNERWLLRWALHHEHLPCHIFLVLSLPLWTSPSLMNLGLVGPFLFLHFLFFVSVIVPLLIIGR